MRQYIIRRLLLAIPVLWGVSLIVFFSIRIVPGDAITAQLAQVQNLDMVDMEKLRHNLGLDQPAYIQYIRWITGVVHGDLGRSYLNDRPVGMQIVERLPVTLELALLSMAFAIIFAIPLGVLTALYQDAWVDQVGRVIAILGISVPAFVIGTLMVLMPALLWQYAPPIGFVPFWQDPMVNLQQMVPPSVALGVLLSAVTMRLTRSSMLEVLREDYIRTANAKGLRQRVVVYRHALKNALIPVVTVLGQQFSGLLGGTLVIESIFTLPGIGLLTIRALNFRDYAQIQGNVLFVATAFVLGNLLVDLSYAWLDPRIRYS